MRVDAAGRVRELAAILSILSLVVVFGAVRGMVPASVLPRVDPLIAAIPHLNALVSLAALASLVVGIRAIRRNRVTRHRAAMLTTTLLFLCFLALYLYRIILVGPKPFPGPNAVYRLIYLPVLSVHILCAVLSLPPVYYVLLLAATRPVAAIRESPHPRVGRVAASLWAVAFALGIAVYLLLYAVY